jgi:hypothetical protein
LAKYGYTTIKTSGKAVDDEASAGVTGVEEADEHASAGVTIVTTTGRAVEEEASAGATVVPVFDLVTVGPGRYNSSPRHPMHFEPLFY